MTFKTTDQKEQFQNYPKFYITNNILFDCIGMGNPKFDGFNGNKESFGYALLTYFTSYALNIRRNPFCLDRVYSTYCHRELSEYREILEKLNSKEVDEIINEVIQLYEHTQKALENAELEYIYLRRQIRYQERKGINFNLTNKDSYAETLVMLRKACDELNIKEIQIEMDMLNSFTDEAGFYQDTNKPLCLELKIPAKDVFYCSQLIGERKEKSYPVESGEWVILNHSPNGIMTIPVASIKYNETDWNFDNMIDPKKFIEGYSPIVIRQPYRWPENYPTYGIKLPWKRRLGLYLLDREYE
ncbi:hypothetical protein ACLSZ7_06595 [Avibacterium gallinarum]|uniref:hypothetical protein n=1 Tax=Avibacterium gallinarum TaxID=755 RepID=UPI003BF7EFC3